MVDVVTSMRVRAVCMIALGGALLVWTAPRLTARQLVAVAVGTAVGAAFDLRLTPKLTIARLAGSAEREPAGAVRRPLHHVVGMVVLSSVLITVSVGVGWFAGPGPTAGAAGLIVYGGVATLVRARRLLADERRERVRLSASAWVRPRFRRSSRVTYYLTPEHLR